MARLPVWSCARIRRLALPAGFCVFTGSAPDIGQGSRFRGFQRLPAGRSLQTELCDE
jgi:hypothetical protein